MIVNFSIQNFGPIRDKQVLSFEAEKSTQLEDYYIIHSSGLRLLKLALIYGANASGKTTILNALEFLRDLVLEPVKKKTDPIVFEPFLFDSQTLKQNSILSIDFLQNSIRYIYEVEFNKKAIVREELTFYNPNKANVFRRTTDLDKQFTDIRLGPKVKKNKTFEKTLESNTLWNNTVLGGFLKTNIELPELNEVIDWFNNYLMPVIYTSTDLQNYVRARIENSEIDKNSVIRILQKADFNISDIIINEEKNEIPENVQKMLAAIELPQERIDKLINTPAKKINFEHTIYDVKYALPFELESEGTQRYFGFAGILSLLVNQSIAIPIDEIESSLHPDLFTHFLLAFLVNSKNSQAIATTHNREILNNKDIFRKDAIWFTDKSETCATELYSLSDFDSSVIRDTSSVYNAYKIGKFGGVPHLGDYYIDLADEKK
jgi:hypothetical protein